MGSRRQRETNATDVDDAPAPSGFRRQ
jgi:hypothetical protein